MFRYLTGFGCIVAVTGWLWVPVPAEAQGPRVLTLDEAIALADDQNPQLRAGSAGIEAARAGIVTAQGKLNPTAGMAAGGQSIRAPGNIAGLVTSYSYSQSLELGGLRPTRIAYAERGRESSEKLLEATRLAVLSGVRRAFYQALRQSGEIGILTENQRLVEELRNRIRVRVEVGEAGRLELTRAEAEVVVARTAVNRAQLQYIAAVSQLRAAMGGGVEADITPKGAVEVGKTLPPLEVLRREVLERHPQLLLARAEVRRAEARVEYEKAQRRPQPEVRADVDIPPDSPTYRVGLLIPLPVRNRREGPIAEAVALVKQAQAVERSRQVELLAATDGAYGRYQETRQQLEAFETGLLKEAEEALRAGETAYQLGERGILEVLDAQRVLRTVRLDFLNAQFDREAALIDLDELRAVDLRTKKP
jgi:cobalt-zinc-cadmium efflux system outer membrane protein